LIDPNPAVAALARKNFETLGFGERTTVRNDKAENVLPTLEADVDLALLDADGPKDMPPEFRGKGIYALLAERAFPRMTPGALLAVHNDYEPGVGENDLSRAHVERMADRHERFHAFCHGHFAQWHVAASPDGFGVYLKGA
jgi:predicted O-methyltransferase YrrM